MDRRYENQTRTTVSVVVSVGLGNRCALLLGRARLPDRNKL